MSTSRPVDPVSILRTSSGRSAYRRALARDLGATHEQTRAVLALGEAHASHFPEFTRTDDGDLYTAFSSIQRGTFCFSVGPDGSVATASAPVVEGA